MKTFKSKDIFNMEIMPDQSGVFVLKSDALEMISKQCGFVIAHAEDIENEVGDFGKLKDLLEFVRGVGNS